MVVMISSYRVCQTFFGGQISRGRLLVFNFACDHAEIFVYYFLYTTAYESMLLIHDPCLLHYIIAKGLRFSFTFYD